MLHVQLIVVREMMCDKIGFADVPLDFSFETYAVAEEHELYRSFRYFNIKCCAIGCKVRQVHDHSLVLLLHPL